MELKVIILSCITMGVLQHYNDQKEKTNRTEKYED